MCEGTKAEGGACALPDETGAVDGGVRFVYDFGDASAGATSARPPICTPRREKSVPPAIEDECGESREDLPSSPVLLLRPTERGVARPTGPSISTMATLRRSAPPSVGTLGRLECRAATLCPWPLAGCFSDVGSASTRGVWTSNCSAEDAGAGVATEAESSDSEYWDE